MKHELRNLVSRAELKQRMEADSTPRKTLSFYRYHPIASPSETRDELYENLEKLGVLGRVYVAREGINAQISVPEANLDALREFLNRFDFSREVRFNFAAQDDGKSFYLLKVKARARIVADGIEDPTFSMENRGEYLDAASFNELTSAPETLVVDMRNSYEFEVGHFEGALEVPSETFRDQLPRAVQLLQGHEDQNIVMYCTGGIRCEKASAFLRHHGFIHVYHLEGGILEYVRQTKAQGLENKFRGKNFVFDERLAESISPDVLGYCHHCGAPSDTHRNCAVPECNRLFLGCEVCHAKFHSLCPTCANS